SLHVYLFIVFSYVPSTTDIYTLSYTTLFRSGVPLESRPAVQLKSRRVQLKTKSRRAQLKSKSRRARTERRRAASAGRGTRHAARSEEHTSELQSRGHLVCRLLLEKKKKNPTF